MAGTGMLAPLFERLAASEGEPEAFDRQALLESVLRELSRLLNTRRAPRPDTGTRAPSIVDYGIADWTALQQQRSDDRRRLAREIRSAIGHFEPRLQLHEVEIEPLPGQPQQLSIRLRGTLRGGTQRWPVALVVEQASDGLEVRHERLD